MAVLGFLSCGTVCRSSWVEEVWTRNVSAELLASTQQQVQRLTQLGTHHSYTRQHMCRALMQHVQTPCTISGQEQQKQLYIKLLGGVLQSLSSRKAR